MMKRKVKATVNDLMAVFEFSSDDMTHYLNIESGKVAMYSNLTGGFDEDGNEIANSNAFADDKYVEITGMHPYESFRDMELYVSGLDEGLLKTRLLGVLKDKGAFRRFKQVIDNYPEAKQGWLSFKKERILQRVHDWLEENDLELEHE